MVARGYVDRGRDGLAWEAGNDTIGTQHSHCERASVFSAEESQLEGLENVVTQDPELQEHETEGGIEDWGGSLCWLELR